MARKHTPIHLRPHAGVAERVLVPGDPGRALRLAQELIDAPKMLNHHRGLWGYTGPALSDGELLTIQSSGLGGPSAAAVVADLAALGARRAVRVGTCTALDSRLRPGDVLVADRVLDPAGEELRPAPALLEALLDAAAGAAAGMLASVDGAHLPAPAGACARDMTSAGLLAAAVREDVAAAVACVVVAGPQGTLAEDALHAAEVRLGRAALVALG